MWDTNATLHITCTVCVHWFCLVFYNIIFLERLRTTNYRLGRDNKSQNLHPNIYRIKLWKPPEAILNHNIHPQHSVLGPALTRHTKCLSRYAAHRTYKHYKTGFDITAWFSISPYAQSPHRRKSSNLTFVCKLECLFIITSAFHSVK